jgi:hypothetical protein
MLSYSCSQLYLPLQTTGFIVMNHVVKVVLNQLGQVSHLSCYIQARVIGVMEVIFEKGMIYK